MEENAKTQTDPFTPKFKYQDLGVWIKATNTCTKLEEFNLLVTDWNAGRTTAGIHPFVMNGDMGLAKHILNNRAAIFGFEVQKNGYFQPKAKNE